MSEEKTVGEILESEGVIKPLPKEREKPKAIFGEEEIDIRKVVMSVEKLKTELDTLKEIKFQSDEKLRDVVEKLGEIRSLLFQRETLIKETEIKVKKLEDIVSDISPTNIMKEMEKRKQETLQVQAKAEKVEEMNRINTDDIKRLKEILQNIKSVENLQKILSEIEDMVSKAHSTRADMDRLAGKTERFYLETENRVKEFPGYKAKVEQLDELSKEIMKSVDDVHIKLGNFVSKSDLEDFKKGVNDILMSNRHIIDSKIKELENFLSIPEEETISRLNELKQRQKIVSNLLANIEEQYRSASISEKAYNEIKSKNENVLRQVDEEIKMLESGGKFTLKSLPSIIDTLGAKVTLLEKSTEEQKIYTKTTLDTIEGRMRSLISDTNFIELKNRIDSLESEKLFSITGAVKRQTDIIEDVVSKIKETSNKISSIEIRIKFFEIMDSLIRMDNSKEISVYLIELENLITNMKNNNMWDSTRNNLTINLLMDIANNWSKYGYAEIAKMFFNEVEKMKAPEMNKYMLKY